LTFLCEAEYSTVGITGGSVRVNSLQSVTIYFNVYICSAWRWI